MFQYQGKTAFITGASSGIGAEFARELAGRGMNLILCARATVAMDKLAEELAREHQISAHVLTLDLSKPNAPALARTFVKERGLGVDLLINNAGFMTYGLDESLDLATEQAEIQINCAAVVGLTHVFLPDMLKRRAGGIINVASLAAFQPIPYMAVYAATKAFVVSYSVAMHEECHARNVRIVALCPGTTATAMYEHAHAEHESAGTPRTPQQVVETGLYALNQGRALAVDGWINRIKSLTPRLVPQWLSARAAGRILQPYDALKRVPQA